MWEPVILFYVIALFFLHGAYYYYYLMGWLLFKCWVGQKLHLGFSIRYCGKTQGFLANTIQTKRGQSRTLKQGCRRVSGEHPWTSYRKWPTPTPLLAALKKLPGWAQVCEHIETLIIKMQVFLWLIESCEWSLSYLDGICVFSLWR